MKTGTITMAVLGLAAPAIAVSCGLSNGYDKGTAAYYFNNNGSLANFDSCSALCLSETKCESFAIGDSQCLLYADPLYVVHPLGLYESISTLFCPGSSQ